MAIVLLYARHFDQFSFEGVCIEIIEMLVHVFPRFRASASAGHGAEAPAISAARGSDFLVADTT